MLGITIAVTLEFNEVDTMAALLLLPFHAYATFGTLLLGLSMQGGSSTEVLSSTFFIQCRGYLCGAGIGQ
jgi:hypothetical protein